VPFSSIDSANPEDLWRYIQQQREQGIDALAIPHNANVSDGLMWSYANSNHSPITREYAETRASIERLAEITQHKGTNETRPELSPNDEFASFELIENLLTIPRPSNVHGSYVREAYARGLDIEKRTGANPFQFGLIGSSDYHTGLSRSSENDTPSLAEPALDVKKLLQDSTTLRGVKVSTGGLAGVWAESNTREAIFDALYRRETFATSGTRPRVRFFSGFHYPAGITKQRDWVKRAYAGGVPMGADLRAAAAGGKKDSPRFLVHAVKDPDGANLDRIQIVKIWLEDDAQKEQVYDVSNPSKVRCTARACWRFRPGLDHSACGEEQVATAYECAGRDPGACLDLARVLSTVRHRQGSAMRKPVPCSELSSRARS